MFRKFALSALAGFTLAASASPTQAAEYIFDDNGDLAEISFNGFSGDPSSVIANLTSQLRLRLLAGAGTNVFLFSYALSNTSTNGGPDSRVSGLAFDSDPDVAAVLTLGEFSRVGLNGNYPNGIGPVEVCLTNSRSCAGGGNGGARLGDPATGVFALAYARPQSSVTLSDFYVRYQGLSGLGRTSSATGEDVASAVPEPGTWMLMIMGFGAIGFALRRRRTVAANQSASARIRFAA